MKVKIKVRRNPYKAGDKVRFIGYTDIDELEETLMRGRVYTVNIACHGKFDQGWYPCIYIKGLDRPAFHTKGFKKVK
jgi:hypothetical protein